MNRRTRIVPAILTDDPTALESMIRQAESFTDYVQIDIMDGQFVPSRSITWKHLADISINLSWEVHLMVLRPEEHLKDFQQAGARKIIFHYEATSSPQKVISMARDLSLGAGLAVNPETAVAAILPLVDDVDSVLFLTVHPGFYGGKFLPEVMNKVAELRRARPKLEIGVDGGIKENNIIQIASAGVDVIYVGSAIFLQPKPGESFRHLSAMVRHN